LNLPPPFIEMLLRALALVLLSLPQIFAINCHVCAGRDIIGAMVFPVLQSLGAGSLIPPAGNCSDNAQLCPTQNYCFKRIDTYHIQDGSGWGRAKAHYYSKGCDINAVAGSTVAYQLNKCVKYQEEKANGYKVVRKICACNNRDLCNGDGLTFSFISALLIFVISSLFLY
ncbi:hypothetical protein PRIPAC_80450, partial [Pristionchus pacificus]